MKGDNQLNGKATSAKLVIVPCEVGWVIGQWYPCSEDIPTQKLKKATPYLKAVRAWIKGTP